MRDWDAERLARAAGAELISEGAMGAEPISERAAGAELISERAMSAEPGAAPGPVGVSIDSRTLAPGELFVGLGGARSDGGRFAAQALAAGAWGVLVAPEHARAAAAATQSPERAAQRAILAHRDPLAGLQQLAHSWLAELRRAGARAVAITGSTGKTSTKDILAALLAGSLRVARSPENLNTEIGLPLAILAAPSGTEALVLELAMRGPGQIAALTQIAEPEVGVVLNVGPVHLELLGSLEAVAAAKAELIAGLAPGASVVLPADEPLLDPHRRDDLVTITFGPRGEVRLVDTDGDGGVVIEDRPLAGRSQDRASSGRERARMELRPSFRQAHNLSNLLAAVAAARALGLTPSGELDVRFSGLRGEHVRLPGEIVLIDDCYNANPMSMRAAIDDLIASAQGRRVAVLGDMLELGPEGPELHRQIGAYAAERGVDVLVTVGPLAAQMGDVFDGEQRAAPDAQRAAELVAQLLLAGDTVLVKGSRGVGLERVAQTLARTPEHARAGGG
ncbi:MAG TPA: UDP-N-acetylmuramoyl-tripeptide--D-alanyl-D-alanine ligase [Solirubrobacteraceae bacterium]|nr:UDP-N-acetylmuramoyl-tripeptide--D-alanyl-D-alanine ligase [Solirubrobacteraceae bacterium]